MKKDTIKILQVIDILNVGGGERVFIDMCNILQENNTDVSILFILNGGILKDELNKKIKVFELYRKNKWNLFTMYECSKILNNFDIVHCHFRHVYKYISIIKFFFNINCKLILNDHFGAISVNSKIPFLFDTILKPKYYIGVSESLTGWAKNKLKIKDNNVFLLPNIILKKEIEVKSKKYGLILVSNIKPLKNNQFAIELSYKLNKKLLLIGKNQDNNYFENINKLKNNSFEIIENCTGAQEFIPQSKLGLHTSKSETGPLVLIEYLAHGLPFLAYQTGEVALILKEYFPEYFIDNFDIELWIERIKKIGSEKPDLEKMNYVFNKHFGKEQYFEKLNSIYTCLIN